MLPYGDHTVLSGRDAGKERHCHACGRASGAHVRAHEKGTPDGEMSNLLHNDVKVGDEVVLSAPFGSNGTMHTWFLNQDQDSGAPSFTGFMDVNAVELPLHAEYYLCGPLSFLHSERSSLSKGVPPKDLRYEVFGPDLWQADFQ